VDIFSHAYGKPNHLTWHPLHQQWHDITPQPHYTAVHMES